MNVSQLKTLHLILWEEFSKKSFIIQFIVILLVVNYCRGIIFIRSPLVSLTSTAAVLSIPFFFFQPILLIFLIIILTASIFHYIWLPLIPFFGIGNLLITDLLFILAVVYIIGRKLYYKHFYNQNYPLIRTPMNIPVAMFFLTIVIALLNTLFLLNGEFHTAFRSFRTLAYYALFFPIINLIKNKKDLFFFIRGVFFIAIFTALVTIAQQVVGTSMMILPGKPSGQVQTLSTVGYGQYSDLTRAIPPGLQVIFISFITLVCLGITGGYKINTLILYAGICILSMGLLFTFYRIYWISTFLSILLFFPIATTRQKTKFILWSFWGILVAGTILLYAVNVPPNKATRLIDASLERVFSLGRVKAIKGSASDTLHGRVLEIERAIKNISRNPILGIGFTPYKRIAKEMVTKTRWFDIHNSLLAILMRLGIVGFIPFLWVSALFLIRGFRNWKKIKDPYLSAICIGFTISYIGTLITGIVEPVFNTWRGVIIIAVIWATNEMIYRIEGIEDNRK